MQWSDEAIILSVRAQGEKGRVLTLLTPTHGRHAGFVRGGGSGSSGNGSGNGSGKRSRSGLYLPGNQVMAEWRARLETQLGQWRIEPLQSHAAHAFASPLRLAVLASACALCEAVLPERQPMPTVYAGLCRLLQVTDEPRVPAAYARWEFSLLRAIGYGLDLGHDQALNEEIAYLVRLEDAVIVPQLAGDLPRGAAAGLFLPLPRFLLAETAAGTGITAPPPLDEVRAALRLSGSFLERHALANGVLPPARKRVLDLLRRAGKIAA